MPKKDGYDKLESSLEQAVQSFDMDGVLYRLTQIVVKYRDEAANEKSIVNPEEEKYWQNVLCILSEAQSKVEGL